MPVQLDLPLESVRRFCRENRIRGLWLFGSVLHENFGPDSDVDVLIEFEDGVHHSLFDMVAMEQDLSKLLGRRADLIERRAVERSENYIRRHEILHSLEPVYVGRDEGWLLDMLLSARSVREYTDHVPALIEQLEPLIPPDRK